MNLSEPVVVARSQPGEMRWGHFQFPTLSRLPDGALLVGINDAEDATSNYGKPLRRCVSTDDGRTWQPAEQSVPGSGPHAMCAEVFNGEYLTLSSSTMFDLAAAGVQMPAAVSTAPIGYDAVPMFYRVDQCPAPVREYLTRLPAWRWTPTASAWKPESITYDVAGHLCWTIVGQQAVSHTWFEHAPLRHGGELLYVDYRTNCLRADGTAPDNFSCLLMASRDNGRSFQKRSVLATGYVYEPMLATTTSDELICVIRGATHIQRPMLLTHSRDQGHTWEAPRELFDFGVFPALVRLANGVLLLAFGRPGVWVSASLDGSGRTWTDPVPVIQGDAGAIMAHTCGYTNLLPVSDDAALLVYSDFQHVGPDGQTCKSIEVRRITVGGTGAPSTRKITP